MIRTTLVTVAAASLLRVCGTNNATPPVAPVQAGTTPTMIPEHGGAVAVSGGLVSEVAALPDGRMVAYVRDPQRAPVVGASVQLQVRKPDGQLLPVPVTYDPTMQAYVGRPMGITPGAYPVQVQVQPPGAAAPVQIVTPPVNVTAVTPVPPARYGGQVQIVGDHAVEMVATPSGDMAMFWMNLDGTPIPANQVQAPNVTVTVNGRPHVLPTRVEGDRIVAHVPYAPSAPIAVSVPSVTVRGVPYTTVVAPAAPVVAELPPPRTVYVEGPQPPVVQAGFMPPPPSVQVNVPQPGVIVGAPVPGVAIAAPVPVPTVAVAAPAPPGVYVAPPGPPGVVFAAPVPQPAVVVAPPAPGVEVDVRGPRGHAYGYWRNRGGVEVGVAPPGPPGPVYVGPPRPGVVFVGPGGGPGPDRDHDEGGRGGWGHDEDHGRGGWGGHGEGHGRGH